MTKTVSIIIRGRVQGVGFRFCSYDKFVELGLSGKAENGKDGTVMVTATGEEEALQQFIDWARKGPEGARVDGVDVSESTEPTNT